MADLVDLRGLSLEREGPDGPVTVLQGLDLSVARGERIALLGGNGSGKSTLLRYLATPGVLAGARVGLVFQDPDEQLIAGSVAEEVTLGRPSLAAMPILREFGLEDRASVDPHVLSAGEKQRLQLAVVLAGAPDLLLLDEPTSLQDEPQTAWIRDRLASWPGAMIWATQRADEAGLCTRALILHEGRLAQDGPTAAVLASREAEGLVRPDAAPLEPAASRAARGGAQPVIAELQGIACRFGDGEGFGEVDLVIRAGDRVGITGRNGCGKSTLLSVLAGLRRPMTGRVSLGGRPLYRQGPQDLDHGLVALAPQFPEYLFCRGDVAAEIHLDPRLRHEEAGAFLTALGLAPELAGRHPHDLSGGQKRRLALGLALRGGRPLILLDEPTAALDAQARALVVELVASAPVQAAVVIASHDHRFLAACGCRSLLLERGRRGLRDV